MAEPNTRLPSRIEITADQLGTTVPIPVASEADAHLIQVDAPNVRVALLARLAPDLPWSVFDEVYGSGLVKSPPWPELAARMVATTGTASTVTVVSI